MSGYSKIIMVGNVVRDPELRYTPQQTPVVDFALAVNRKKSGGGDDEVAFVDCTAWAKTAEFISKFFQKGKKVLVEGHFTQERWQDDGGNNRTRLKVTVERTEFMEARQAPDGQASQQAYAPPPPGDDIPF